MRVKTRVSAAILPKATQRIKTIIVALVLAGLTKNVVADPISTYDDGMTSALILKECKADFSEFSHKSSAEPKLKALGDAAWRQLWTVLDELDGAHHDENGRKADFELKKHSVADLARARELLSSKGCSALVPHALDVLDGYLR
jgi:hypothetical protein